MAREKQDTKVGVKQSKQPEGTKDQTSGMGKIGQLIVKHIQLVKRRKRF